MEYTPAQIRAIRIYQGDVSGTDPFWGDKKAYCTLNALFFPGIDNEIARSAEGKKLNPAFLSDENRLFGLCLDLLNAFFVNPAEKTITTWRVERLHDYHVRKRHAETVSFTSTSKAGFLEGYTDKKGLALMRFDVASGTPCIDMQSALPEYFKSEESEVLLPPGLELSFEDMPFTDGLSRITDAEGMPPEAFSLVKTGRLRIPCANAAGPVSGEGMFAGKRVYSALNEGMIPDPEDISAYTEWKSRFRSSVFTALQRGSR